MTKSRKKKNFKLRRRIQRTVAAVTMISAVVVAAIPVENLDRVRADYKDTADFDYSNEVSDGTNLQYTDLYKASTYEDAYTQGTNTAKLQIQRIENGTITNLFEATKPNKDAQAAIITKNSLADSYTTLAIQDQEYYEYVQFDYDFCQELKSTLNGLTFTLDYSENTESVTGGTSSPTGGGSYTFNNINLITLGTSTGSVSGNASGAVQDTNGFAKEYKNYNLGTIDAKTVFEQFGSGFLTSQDQLINAYNQKIDAYRAELNTIVGKITNNTAGQQELDRWNAINTGLNGLVSERNTAKTMTKTYVDFVGDSTDLTDLEQYIICQYFGSNQGRNNLRVYSLVKVTNASGNSVYIPRLKDGENQIGDQQVDPDKYLVSGKAVIDGIAHEAFAEAKIRELTIPSNIKFIGADAFKKSNLTNVTINDANCKIIGDRAFADCSNLASVSFTAGNGSSLITIAHEAFAGASSLAEVTIPNKVEEIGEGCFSSTGIRSLTFAPGGVKTTKMNIRKFAFYDCTGLSSVSFPEVTDGRKFWIERAAFALHAGSNGGNLKNFTFPASNDKVNFGTDNDADKYDYILANRTGLKEVVWPGLLDNKIPDNTLWGCANLDFTKFPDGANRGSYDPKELFMGVYNENFYVEGPIYGASGNASRAVPRETTWHAKAGKNKAQDGTVSYTLVSVPYKFTDASGDHFEIGVKEDPDDEDPKYIATIDVTDEGKKEATLANYFAYGTIDPKDRLPINIPAMVGQYTIVAIGNNCFNDDIKNKIYELTIEDGSVRRIEAEAFKDAKELQLVKIGNDVRFIGKDAFAGCSLLQDVIFSQSTTSFLNDDTTPEEWAAELVIEENAFKTGSEYLTFHGAINSNYAPFKLAMSDNNKDLTGSKSQVCYKSDAPLHLTVIRDNATGKATLIDYPHYEEIDLMNKELLDAQKDKYQTISDYSISDKFEAVNGVREHGGKYKDMETMDPEEDAVVLQTLTMRLPDGIESIDSKAYFSNTVNSSDFAYFNRVYEKNDKDKKYEYESTDRELNKNRIGEEDVRKLYETYEGPDPVDDKTIKTIPGLFSGYFNESIVAAQAKGLTDDPDKPDATEDRGLIWETYDSHYYKEDHDRGNDHLTTITMPTVEEIPNYGFDSNENLKILGIDEALDKVGAQPFRACKSLYQINTGDSKKYAYENMLFYENQGDDTNVSYKIVQCLEGRGRRDVEDGQYGPTVIDSATNPGLAKVSSIADYAFANCDKILRVNLEDAVGLKIIPTGAFSECVKLSEVILPASVNRIDDSSFEGVHEGNTFKVEIPNPNCVISDKAFDFDRTEQVTISGVQYIDEATKEESTCYNSYLQLDKIYGDQIQFVPLGSTYTVRFYDEDYNQLGETYEIQSGQDVLNPPTKAAEEAAKTGRKFDRWLCLLDNGTVLEGEKAYTNVTENRKVMAQYVDDPSSVVPDGNDYNLTVENGKALIDGSIVSTFPVKLKGGTKVTVIANDEANFKVWTVRPGSYSFPNADMFTTTFTMPNADITVTANAAIGGGDTPNPDGTYTVTVNGGTGGGNYKPGATVTITANTPPTGQSFVNWTTATTGVTFANASSASTTFVMPSSNVTVTANFSGGGSNNPDDPNNPDGKKYKLTVNYGSGSGEYASGTTITITANAPDSSRREFSRWTTSSNGVTFASATSATTTIVMPASDAVVTANYKTKSSSDDDDDDDDSSSNRRPGSGSTSTVPGRPGDTTTTPGTSTEGTNGSTGTSTDNNGNRIYITKNGVSNKDIASVSVDGSTDNFIVRITESPEATAAVEEALINTYGSLDGLAYFPMDISLYDSTGQHKITDTHGLNITVTMPIPDVLIQYGGNNRVAAADNGNLQQLTPRFTTIDGIACISFVPPHFSPYVIYVDTNNLTAGQTLDSTPSTGDPIHPKWFAAMGMACASVLLFATSNGKRRKDIKTA